MVIKRVLIFLFTGILLVVLTYLYSDMIMQCFKPLYQWAIQQFEYRFNDIQLSIQQVKGTDYLVIKAHLPPTFFANGQMLKTSNTIYNVAGMPIGNVMQPLVIITTFLIAWLATVWKAYLYRFCLMLPAIILIMLSDMPIQLIYVSWQGFDKTLGLNIANTSWYGPWSDFLNGGGLIAISITIGLSLIFLADVIVKRTSNQTT